MNGRQSTARRKHGNSNQVEDVEDHCLLLQYSRARNAARATLGEGLSVQRLCARVAFTLAHVSTSPPIIRGRVEARRTHTAHAVSCFPEPPFDPGQSGFLSPVLALLEHHWPSHAGLGLNAGAHIHPSLAQFTNVLVLIRNPHDKSLGRRSFVTTMDQ